MTPDEQPAGHAAVRAALAGLGPARMPDAVTARLRARLDRELARGGPEAPTAAGSATPEPPTPSAAPTAPPESTGRCRLVVGPAASRFRARAGLALLAAAAAVLVALPVTGLDQRSGPPVRTGTTDPLADELRAAAGDAGEPVGPLADPVHRRGCLAAVGVPDSPLVTTRPYPVAARPGVLLVLGTPERGRFRLVVVDPGCGPGRGRLLADLATGP